MSHNLYTINNEGANVLSYIGASKGIIYVGRGESASIPNSPAFASNPHSWANSNTMFFWYDSNPINTISGASFTQSNNWIEEFNLPAGDYEIRASVSVQMADGSYHFMVFMQDKPASSSWNSDGHSDFNHDAMISNRSSTGLISVQRVEDFKFSKIFSYSTATTIRFKAILSSHQGTGITDSNNRISETQYIYIRKLS